MSEGSVGRDYERTDVMNMRAVILALLLCEKQWQQPVVFAWRRSGQNTGYASADLSILPR